MPGGQPTAHCRETTTTSTWAARDVNGLFFFGCIGGGGMVMVSWSLLSESVDGRFRQFGHFLMDAVRVGVGNGDNSTSQLFGRGTTTRNRGEIAPHTLLRYYAIGRVGGAVGPVCCGHEHGHVWVGRDDDGAGPLHSNTLHPILAGYHGDGGAAVGADADGHNFLGFCVGLRCLYQ